MTPNKINVCKQLSEKRVFIIYKTDYLPSEEVSFNEISKMFKDGFEVVLKIDSKNIEKALKKNKIKYTKNLSVFKEIDSDYRLVTFLDSIVIYDNFTTGLCLYHTNTNSSLVSNGIDLTYTFINSTKDSLNAIIPSAVYGFMYLRKIDRILGMRGFTNNDKILIDKLRSYLIRKYEVLEDKYTKLDTHEDKIIYNNKELNLSISIKSNELYLSLGDKDYIFSQDVLTNVIHNPAILPYLVIGTLYVTSVYSYDKDVFTIKLIDTLNNDFEC